MINSQEIGRTIAELRKNAGYSQKTLAEVLNITDKAVSKWERGLSCPDITLLPKLSALLDSDIESLLSGMTIAYSNTWKGVLVLDDCDVCLSTLVYDKPLVYYLLSNFLLVNITEITIIGSKEKYLEISRIMNKLKIFESLIIHYSICVDFNYINTNDVFLINGAYFLFSTSLTRQYQSFMSEKKEAITVLQSTGDSTPLFFYPRGSFFAKNKAIKKLGRGVICIPLNSYENISDVSLFVRIYQKYHSQKISDLEEIIKLRRI